MCNGMTMSRAASDSLRLRKSQGQLSIVLIYFVLTLFTLSELSSSSEAGVVSSLPADSLRQLRSPETDLKSTSSSRVKLGQNSKSQDANSTAGSGPLPASVQRSTTLIEPRGKKPEVSLPNKETSSVPGVKNDGTSTTGTGNKSDLGNIPTNAPAFDEKAIQRSFLVLAGLGTILLAYFGIKFACVKKRKTGGTGNSSRYGLVESSEMDLLENIEEDDEDEEDNTLFDLHSHRRT